MFIELTDHLRCPAGHEEAFLVLVPTAMEGRDVRTGTLGCLVCRREFPVEEGRAHFGPPTAVAARSSAVDAAALHAFLGLEGPGGVVALVGDVAPLAGPLADLLPGVALVTVNAPGAPLDGPRVSALEGPMLPVKTRHLRGVVLGGGYGEDPAWVADALRATLPGRRVVGAGAAPDVPGVLAAAGGWWVAERGNG